MKLVVEIIDLLDRQKEEQVVLTALFHRIEPRDAGLDEKCDGISGASDWQ
jgi:hypothetical protein